MTLVATASLGPGGGGSDVEGDTKVRAGGGPPPRSLGSRSGPARDGLRVAVGVRCASAAPGRRRHGVGANLAVDDQRRVRHLPSSSRSCRRRARFSRTRSRRERTAERSVGRRATRRRSIEQGRIVQGSLHDEVVANDNLCHRPRPSSRLARAEDRLVAGATENSRWRRPIPGGTSSTRRSRRHARRHPWRAPLPTPRLRRGA